MRSRPLTPRDVTDLEVAADWKVVVEQWLESPQPHQHFAAAESAAGDPPGGGADPAGGADRAGPQPHPALRFRGPRVRGSRARDAWRAIPGNGRPTRWLKAQIGAGGIDSAGLVGAAGDGRGNRTRHTRARALPCPHSRIAAGAARELTAVRPGKRSGGLGWRASGMRSRKQVVELSMQFSSRDRGPGS